MRGRGYPESALENLGTASAGLASDAAGGGPESLGLESVLLRGGATDNMGTKAAMMVVEIRGRKSGQLVRVVAGCFRVVAQSCQKRVVVALLLDAAGQRAPLSRRERGRSERRRGREGTGEDAACTVCAPLCMCEKDGEDSTRLGLVRIDGGG